VARTVRAQSENDWPLPYTAMREVDAGNRFNIFLRCASHLHHHLGADDLFAVCIAAQVEVFSRAVASRCFRER